MRQMLIAATLALLATACGASGGAAPLGGTSTDPPNVSPAPTAKATPLPSGHPDVDYYGY
jgi:hypothetical protein